MSSRQTRGDKTEILSEEGARLITGLWTTTTTICVILHLRFLADGLGGRKSASYGLATWNEGEGPR